MTEKEIFKFAKELGCCDGCCVRYLGVRNPNAYEKLAEYVSQYQDEPTAPTVSQPENGDSPDKNGEDADGPPPVKRRKWEVCISCLGIMQPAVIAECCQHVKETMEKKKYSCPTFACGLSAPIATIVRERCIALQIKEKFPEYNDTDVTPLKEAWRAVAGVALALAAGKERDSGTFSPLLVTCNIEYDRDIEELEPLKRLSPNLFATRSEQRRRFAVEFTRRSVEQALDGATVRSVRDRGAMCQAATVPATCVGVTATRQPVYLGGRYIKLSRELPQTPWILHGKRMMESSVQEIIFGPIASLYEISAEDAEHQLKFMSAGREDVDVKCLGNGRPFAVEISDPRSDPTEEELKKICDEISKDGRVIVRKMAVVGREDLQLLKQGEETKYKTYEALCIKLSHNKDEASTLNGSADVTVTQTDIDRINTYTNVPEGGVGKIDIVQKTPIRVLHRRPLLERKRKVIELKAEMVPGHPQLFKIQVKTEAGAYIKEWVHGELGRTSPSLGQAMRADVDILALSVTHVHLDWPSA